MHLPGSAMLALVVKEAVHCAFLVQPCWRGPMCSRLSVYCTRLGLYCTHCSH